MSNLHPPTSTEPIGTFKNVAYARHTGKFIGETTNGLFTVPYEITAPVNPQEGNGTVVVEPPHIGSRLIVRDGALGSRFLFENGFSHAAVGYGNRGKHILKAEPGFTPVVAGQEYPGQRRVSDLRIYLKLALALRNTPPRFIRKAERIYAIGVSESGSAVYDMYKDFGHKEFDITFACLAEGLQPARFGVQKPVIIFNTEADFGPSALPNPAFPQYRWYCVAGGAHVPDSWLARAQTSAVKGTTPINWLPFLQAVFLAGDRWVRDGVQPPPSVSLQVVDDPTDPEGKRKLIARDHKLNALGGIRHPALETREATFLASFVRSEDFPYFGGYINPERVSADAYPAYLRTFKEKTEALFKPGFIRQHYRDQLIREAQLRPPLTYTLNYMEGLFFQSPQPDGDE
jgi:hypothetical protein